MGEVDPNKVTQITSNADIEAIVSQYCESVEAFTTDAKKVGLPPWPKQFYEYLFGLEKTIQTGSSSKDAYEHYYAVFTDPKGMYDAGYKLEDAQKFIREQQKQILDNIVANFKNIPGITQVDTSNICDKFPVDDCKLIKSSLRGNIILTFVYQMLFLDVIKSWNEKFSELPSLINEKWETSQTSENGANNEDFDITKRGFYDLPNGSMDPKAVSPVTGQPDKKDFGNDLGQLSAYLANDVIKKYTAGDVAAFALQETKELNSNTVENASDKSYLFGAITTNGDLVSNNIEHNKKVHKDAIKDAKALLEQVFNKYTKQFLLEINNQEAHTKSAKILQDFNKKYGCDISINQTKNANTVQAEFKMDPDFEEQFPGRFVVNDDVYYNWPDDTVSDKFKTLAGYVLATNGGYKPTYSITTPLEDTDIETGVDGKVKQQLEGYDPHNKSFNLDGNKQNIKLKNATDTFGEKGFDGSDKESNHIYYSTSVEADVAIVKDKFDYPDMSKQKANNAAACSYYPKGNRNKVNTAATSMYKYRKVFGEQYTQEKYEKDSWLFFEELFPNTKGDWTFYEFVLSEFKKYFGMTRSNKVTETNINSADFIGKRLSKLFAELKTKLHAIISKYSNATSEDLAKNSNKTLDDIKFTHSIGDTFFDYIFKTLLTSDKADEISSVEKPKDDFYFGTMIFNKGVEFPMDFAPGESVKKCTNQPDADKVNNKSILFRHIMPPIFTELDTILDNWSKDFNDVNHSFNADWMKNKTLLSDILCTPVGLAYCHFIKSNSLDPQAPGFWTKKINFDKLIDVLKNILAVNIFYKLVLPLIDNKAVNRYLIYEILYNAIFNEEVDFVKDDTQDPEPKVTQSEGFEQDLRSPARLFGGSTKGANGEILNNVIMIHDYNWCPVYNLGHERVNPNDFSKLIIWEFQPNATVSTNSLFKAGGDIVNAVKGALGKAAEALGGQTTEKGVEAGLDKNKKTPQSNGNAQEIKAFISKSIGAGVVNSQINSINKLNSGEKLDKVTDVGWIDKLLNGYWIGQYEIPFFNNNMMKSKSKDAWEMGNALTGTNGLLGALKDVGQGNVQDIPIWSFDKTNQEGINWSTSFYLINDNIGNIKKNLMFISAFAAGTYWIQLNNFQYHCPNLYRVECPGRFFELYTSLDIAVNYYGKTQKLDFNDTEYIFKDYIGLKAYDPSVIGSDIYIPEAYEIIIDSKSLQPNAFNIQYNYLLQGGSSMRPNMNAREVKPKDMFRQASNVGVDATTDTIDAVKTAASDPKAALDKVVNLSNNITKNVTEFTKKAGDKVSSVFFGDSSDKNKQAAAANAVKSK